MRFCLRNEIFQQNLCVPWAVPLRGSDSQSAPYSLTLSSAWSSLTPANPTSSFSTCMNPIFAFRGLQLFSNSLSILQPSVSVRPQSLSVCTTATSHIQLFNESFNHNGEKKRLFLSYVFAGYSSIILISYLFYYILFFGEIIATLGQRQGIHNEHLSDTSKYNESQTK